MTLTQQPFGQTGLSVATLGIGSIGLNHGEDLVIRQMNTLLDAGANLVDTAACYPGSEELIGRELAHRRDEMILVSKCGHHQVLADGSMRSLSISMDDIDAALQRLRTDYIDVMLLHSYDFDLLVHGDALGVLRDARNAGKIGHLGYSGDNHALSWAAQQPLISVVEASVSLVDQYNIQTGLTEEDPRVAVIAKRPIANAAWLHKDDPSKAPPLHEVYARRFAAMDVNFEHYGCSNMGELALRFTISLPQVSCAIVSSTSVQHLAANIAAAEKGPLSAEQCRALQSLFQQCDQKSGGTWLSCN